MPFISLIIYITLIYLRPQEWVKGIIGWPLINISAIVTFAFLLFSPQRTLPRVPQNTFLIAFIASIAMSHLSHFYFGGAYESILAFLPSIVLYFLIVLIVNSDKKLKALIFLLVLLSTILAVQGISQSKSGIGWAGQPVLMENDDDDPDTGGIARITWVGIFNDPNDLGLALVTAFPFALNWLLNGTILLKIGALASLYLLTYAIYLTNSRGAMLALMAVIGTYLFFFFKAKRILWIGLVFMILGGSAFIKFGPSRMDSISSQEESAYGRIDSWYEGFQMLKSNPLFGVGQGMFTEYNRLTAHNSYILCAAETGLIGYFFWFGLIYYSVKSFLPFLSNANISHPVRPLALACMAGLVGFCSAAFFLSRTYIAVFYMLTGISATFANLHPGQSAGYASVSRKESLTIVKLALLTLIGTYVLVRLSL